MQIWLQAREVVVEHGVSFLLENRGELRFKLVVDEVVVLLLAYFPLHDDEEGDETVVARVFVDVLGGEATEPAFATDEDGVAEDSLPVGGEAPLEDDVEVEAGHDGEERAVEVGLAGEVGEEEVAAPGVLEARGGEVEVVLGVGDGDGGESPHLGLPGFEPGDGVIHGLALLGGDSAGVGGYSIAQYQNSERSELAAYQQNQAEG